jgi:hypothetical protein
MDGEVTVQSQINSPRDDASSTCEVPCLPMSTHICCASTEPAEGGLRPRMCDQLRILGMNWRKRVADVRKSDRDIASRARDLPNHGDVGIFCRGCGLWDEAYFGWDRSANASSGWLRTGMDGDEVDMIFRITHGPGSTIGDASLSRDRSSQKFGL